MLTHESKEIARRYFTHWLASKGLGPTELFDREYRFHDPNNPNGLNLDEYRNYTIKFFQAFPNAQFTIADVVAEGDKVVTHYRVHATQAAEWISNIPITGKSFTIEGFELHRIKDGRITEQWSLFDQAGTFRQLEETKH